MRDNTRQDRYWNQMQRLGGTLSHLLKEVPICCFAGVGQLTAAPTLVYCLDLHWCCSGPLQSGCCCDRQVPLSASTPRRWRSAGQAAANPEDWSLEVASHHECVIRSPTVSSVTVLLPLMHRLCTQACGLKHDLA